MGHLYITSQTIVSKRDRSKGYSLEIDTNADDIMQHKNLQPIMSMTNHRLPSGCVQNILNISLATNFMRKTSKIQSAFNCYSRLLTWYTVSVCHQCP